MVTRDYQIREALHSKKLMKYHEDANTRVVDELGLYHGSARADIATINGILQGFEIKSDADTLTRLPLQIEAYDSIFDKSTLVVGEKLYKQAIEKLPKHWGVIVAKLTQKGTVRFSTDRAPTKNKNVDPLSLVRLLWKDEVIGLIEEFGGDRASLRGNRETLYGTLVELVSFTQLHFAVCSALKKRQEWRDQLSPL